MKQKIAVHLLCVQAYIGLKDSKDNRAHIYFSSEW